MFTRKSRPRCVYTSESSTYRSAGMGASRYAKEYAGKVGRELHLLGYPGAQVKCVNQRRIKSYGSQFASYYADFEVWSDAPEEVVHEALDSRTFIDASKDAMEFKAMQIAIALSEWYGKKWVQASRRFAMVYFLDPHPVWREYKEAAQRMWDDTDCRAFSHELEYGIVEYGRKYLAFYSGSRWSDFKYLTEEIEADVIYDGCMAPRHKAINRVIKALRKGKEMQESEKYTWGNTEESVERDMKIGVEFLNGADPERLIWKGEIGVKDSPQA